MFEDGFPAVVFSDLQMSADVVLSGASSVFPILKGEAGARASAMEPVYKMDLAFVSATLHLKLEGLAHDRLDFHCRANSGFRLAHFFAIAAAIPGYVLLRSFHLWADGPSLFCPLLV